MPSILQDQYHGHPLDIVNIAFLLARQSPKHTRDSGNFAGQVKRLQDVFILRLGENHFAILCSKL